MYKQPAINSFNQEEVIAGCLKKQKEFEDQLYKKFAPTMFAICYRYAGNKDDAKDIFQDGFIKVYSQLKNFKTQGSLEGWIKRIFINTALDFCKSKKYFQIELAEKDFKEEENNDLNENLDIPKEKLFEMISNLPHGYRLVFNLYALENYAHKEIAEVLNIDIGTSKSQLYKARKILKTKVLDFVSVNK